MTSKYLPRSSDFVVISGVPTRILRYGYLPTPANSDVQSVEKKRYDGGDESDSSQTQLLLKHVCSKTCQHCVMDNLTYPGDVIVLVIPGNPGIIDFYEEFMETLFGCLKHKIPVWGISHAGHVEAPPGDLSHLKAEAQVTNEVYTLEGQIQHKMEFIRNFVPKKTRFILVGHSIGCHIALEVMKRMPELDVIKTLLLFPTIERMATSPQGQTMRPFLTLRWLTLPPTYALWYTPARVKNKLLQWYFRHKNVSEHVFRASMHLFNPTCSQNALYMGRDELASIKTLDVAAIRKLLPKLIFYYGQEDSWTPISYFKDLKALFPNGDLRLADQGIEHAFVVESGRRVANKCADWIISDILHLTDVFYTMTANDISKYTDVTTAPI